jgi:hypothetical protein
MQAQKAFDSPRRANRGAVAYLRDRLKHTWPKGRTALPPKSEIILTPLNETYKGGGLTAATLIENAAERRKRISADLGVAENLADFFCQFIGGHQPVVNAFSEFLKWYWWRIDQEKAAAGWLSG